MRPSSLPIRIQVSRARGWRKPPGVVYVGRTSAGPGRWGNPYKIGAAVWHTDGTAVMAMDRKDAARLFRERMGFFLFQQPDLLEELRGKDLACWCPVGQPCHGDVLIELANR